MMQVLSEESSTDSLSRTSTQLSPQGGTPDNPPHAQDAVEEKKDSPAKGRWWRLKCASGPCQNRLVQMAISLIVGVVLGVIFSHVIDIKTLYDLNGDYWVGLKKEKGKWKQMDGSVCTEPIKFDDPLRSCCLLDSGKYVAQDCSARRCWICVKSLRGDQ